MSGPDEPGPDTGRRSAEKHSPGKRSLRERVAKALLGFDPVVFEVEHRAAVDGLRQLAGDLHRVGRELHSALVSLQGEMEAIRDRRLPSMEERLDRDEAQLARAESGLAASIEAVERRLDALERAGTEIVRTVEELRDERLPAAVRRSDALIDRLASRVDEALSLAERAAAGEPLPLPKASPVESAMAEALAEIQPVLLERLRGPEAEIAHRMEAYLPLLEGHEPVLDLGCGRGELLALLTERGVEATGVEGDPVLSASARRRGLRIVEGDALEILERLGDGSQGAVTAIHLLEHLPADRLLRLLAEVRRVLRKGGILLAECPNPATLRVGAEEFWNDPTHVRPMPARLLEIFMTSSGFEVQQRRFLRPFPAPERLPEVPGQETGELARTVAALRDRLDEIINGPRDYLLVARRME